MINAKYIGLRNFGFIFGVLSTFCIIVFLIGGSPRGDVQSLAVLRPLAVFACGIGFWTLRFANIPKARFLLIMAVGICANVVFQLVPLPQSLLPATPASDLIAEVNSAAKIVNTGMSITVTPESTLNSLFSLSVPLAVLLLGIQLTRHELYLLLPLVLTLGLLSGFLGMVQVIGDPFGLFYFYQITNNGTAVGLFANRNHHAVLLACLFPMLAVYASVGLRSPEHSKRKSGLAVAAGAMLVPLLLVVGSRSGLIIGVIGLLSVPFIYRPRVFSEKTRRNVLLFNPVYAVVGFGTLIFGSVTVLMARTQAFQRLSSSNQVEDLRFQMWGPIAKQAWDHFPLGSGVGSFASVYQYGEKDTLLMAYYVNQAHNDWLDLFLTSGVLGTLFCLVAIIAFAWRNAKVWSWVKSGMKELAFYRLGAVIVAVLLLASVGDYPLRTPVIQTILVIALLWFLENDAKTEEKTGST